MKIERIDVKKLNFNKRNTRIHTRRNLETLKQSLTEFGQTKPIIINKNGMYVIAGNGTLQAAMDLGWDKIDCHVLDLDENKAMALSVLDNKTSDLSQNDEKMLTEVLQELKEVDFDFFELSGFKDDELERMLDFQSGELFELPEPSKAKPKPQAKAIKKDDVFEVSENDNPKVEKDDTGHKEQVNCVMFGFPFVLTDSKLINELKYLFEFLKDADLEMRQKVEEDFFETVKELLTKQFLR